jgi:hypothetical protein
MEEPTLPARFWTTLRPAWLHRLALAGLFLVIFLTFRPALHHPPREDQWAFLLDTINEDCFVPMALQTYSYNRTRLILAGDYPLFRPVLFIVLSVEKAFFGPRYVYWNLVGIGLHCSIVALFLSLLLRLEQTCPAGSPRARGLRQALAYVLALFFAVNFAGTEMVIWCHIHGYMVYLLLVLATLRLLVDELGGLDPSVSSWRIGCAWLLMLLAAFTYEVGAYYAVCLGGVLGVATAWRGQVRSGVLRFLLFASLLPLFFLTDRLDRLGHPATRPDITEATVLERARLQPTLTNSKRYLLFTLFQPFFPTCIDWGFAERVYIPEPWQAPHAYRRAGPLLFLSFGVVLAGGGLALAQLRRLLADRVARRSLLLLLAPGFLILLHMGIIVLGRMNLRPEPLIIVRNSYYAYIPFLALLVGLYFLWLRAPLERSRAGLAGMGLLLAGLGVLSLCSASKVHAMTTRIRYYYRPLRSQMTMVQQLIDRCRGEANFGISFDPDVYYGLPYYNGLALVNILYPRHIDHENPTHVICADGEQLVILREKDYSRKHGPRYRCLPTFVQPAPGGYMVFRHAGRYYGLHYQEGCFRTDRDDYQYRLEGDSAVEVLEQIPEALRRRAEGRPLAYRHVR